MIELRKVGVDSFEEVLPLLLLFKNRRMSKDHWRRMLFAYRWTNEPHRGYVLYAKGVAVGFLGTIFSERRVLGRVERFCNLSSWIVREEHRGPSVLMVRTVLRDLSDYTIVGYTPSPTTCAVFGRLGFQFFERERVLLPPIPQGVGELKFLPGSFTLAPRTLWRDLAGEERTIYRDLSDSRARHVLLRRNGRQCYLVVRRDRHRRRLPIAELLYVGNREFFWENRLLAQLALFRATGALVISIDDRFVQGRHIPFAWRVPKSRIFLPARPEITPDMIDGLYSELLTLRE